MDHRLLRYVFASLALISSPVARGQIAGSADDPRIRLLRWTAPEGIVPTSFRQWNAKRKPQKMFIEKVYRTPAPKLGAPEAGTILIQINPNLHDSAGQALGRYTAALEARGYLVEVDRSTFPAADDLRAELQSRRQEEGLSGTLLVGDYPVAWYKGATENFPCDLYFMDLDGKWQDTDADGVLDKHTAGTGDLGLEIWAARLPVKEQNWGSSSTLAAAFFNKAADRMAGAVRYQHAGMNYIDDSWSEWGTLGAEALFNQLTVVNDFEQTTTADYKTRLNQQPLAAMLVAAHSYSGGHTFAVHPQNSASYAHVYIHSPREQDVHVNLGSDESYKVWMNGMLAGTSNVSRTCQADQDWFPAHLQNGWNRLLLKTSNKNGAYEFTARLTDPASQMLCGLRYQCANPWTQGEEAPVMTAWLISGFHASPGINFWSLLDQYSPIDESTVPEAGEVAGGKTWQALESQGSHFDFTKYFGEAEQGLVYAFARVYSPLRQQCRLHIGSDDGIRIKINDSVVYTNNVARGWKLDQDTQTAWLSEGWNRLLVKITQYNGPMGFSLRLTDLSDHLIPDLQYDPAPTSATGAIRRWAVRGYFRNDDPATRLNTAYLAGEDTLQPELNTGDGETTWTFFEAPEDISDLDLFLRRDTGWCYSGDVQTLGSPAAFYNLFACGASRFVDQNSLGLAYVLNSPCGLATIGASSTGSMLRFEEFYGPLARGQTIGSAFVEWFNVLAADGISAAEKAWHYGMIMIGDPLLRLDQPAESRASGWREYP